MIYKCVWVPTGLVSERETQEITAVSELMNEYARANWQVTAVNPGTNANTYGGVFVTFSRQA